MKRIRIQEAVLSVLAEKFLDLWKEDDPGITEVKDAKKRLVGLKN
jgi:hypothetical protein